MSNDEIVRLVAGVEDVPTVAEVDAMLIALGREPRGSVAKQVDSLLELRTQIQQTA